MNIKSYYITFGLILAILGCSNKYDGIDPISLVDQASKLYKDGEAQNAIDIWRHLSKNEPDTSYSYGMSMNNLHVHFIFKQNYSESEKLFKEIVKSNMSDKYLTSNIMEPFTNYRYNSCIRMFQLYTSKPDFEKALNFLEMAQDKYKYETSSMSSYKKRLIENEIWKSRLNFDLGDTTNAKNILIKAGMNCDYMNHSKWNSFSDVKYERQIGEELIGLLTSMELVELVNSIENGIDKLKLENIASGKIQSLKINQMEFRIPLYRDIDIDSCKVLLSNSLFLNQLKEEIKEKTDDNK